MQNTENLEVCLNTLFQKFSNVEPHIFAENVNFSQFVGKIRSGDQAKTKDQNILHKKSWFPESVRGGERKVEKRGVGDWTNTQLRKGI